ARVTPAITARRSCWRSCACWEARGRRGPAAPSGRSHAPDLLRLLAGLLLLERGGHVLPGHAARAERAGPRDRILRARRLRPAEESRPRAGSRLRAGDRVP